MACRRRGKKWVCHVYDPATKGKRWVGTFPTRGAARDAERKALARYGRHGETIGEFAERWMDSYPRQRESTNLIYAEQIRPFARDFAGQRLDSITRPQARAWALEHPSGARAARAMLSDALRDGLIADNPFLGLRLQGPGKRLEIPSPKDVEALCDAAVMVWGDYGRRVYQHLIRAAAYTGLRPGELYGLEWADVDEAGSRLRVERQFNARLRKTTIPKNGHPRIVYLTPPAQDALAQVPGVAGNIFVTPRGKRFAGPAQHHYWHPVRCAAHLPQLDFYGLRHHYGTLLANMGLSPYDIAQAMGHRDGGKLAMDRYIRVDAERSMDRIAEAFGREQVAVVRRIGDRRGA